MKKVKMNIRATYYVACPDCEKPMKLLNSFESVLHPETGELYGCEKCNTEYVLKLTKYTK